MKINVCVKKIKFEELTESNVFGGVGGGGGWWRRKRIEGVLKAIRQSQRWC
jgi:hypothetical protein